MSILYKSVACYLLPGKIIVDTLFHQSANISFTTGQQTILDAVVSEEELGQNISRHLNLSCMLDSSIERIKENWNSLIRKSGLKSERAFFQSAKCLHIELYPANTVKIIPFRTSPSRRIFAQLKDEIISLSFLPDTSEMGALVRAQWDKCIFID